MHHRIVEAHVVRVRRPAHDEAVPRRVGALVKNEIPGTEGGRIWPGGNCLQRPMSISGSHIPAEKSACTVRFLYSALAREERVRVLLVIGDRRTNPEARAILVHADHLSHSRDALSELSLIL